VSDFNFFVVVITDAFERSRWRLEVGRHTRPADAAEAEDFCFGEPNAEEAERERVEQWSPKAPLVVEDVLKARRAGASKPGRHGHMACYRWLTFRYASAPAPRAPSPDCSSASCSCRREHPLTRHLAPGSRRPALHVYILFVFLLHIPAVSPHLGTWHLAPPSPHLLQPPASNPHPG
jgi:hypothetical protein